MVVEDQKQYPEFAGNVISIDTSPDLPTLSPAGNFIYSNSGGNARSYLKLGKQMANALLQLMETERKP